MLQNITKYEEFVYSLPTLYPHIKFSTLVLDIKNLLFNQVIPHSLFRKLAR